MNFNLGSVIGKVLAHQPLGLDQVLVDEIAHGPLDFVLDRLDPQWAVPQSTFGSLPPELTINGKFANGSGGFVTDFLIQKVADPMQSASNITIAQSDIHRQGNPYDHVTIDAAGVGHVTVFAGPQVVDPANGVYQANPNRYEWSNNISFGTPNETLQQYLQTHTIQYITKVNGVVDADLHAVYDPAHATGNTPIVFDDGSGHVVINDNTGSNNLVAQSQNMTFSSVNPKGIVLHTGDVVTTELLVTDTATHHIVADNQLVATVGTAPPQDMHLT